MELMKVAPFDASGDVVRMDQICLRDGSRCTCQQVVSSKGAVECR